MDWSHIRKVNRKASARKAKRERAAAERDAAIERLGGEFAVDELRAADVRVIELPRQYVGITDPHVVWTLRGGDWIVWFDFGNQPCGMARLADRHASRAVVVPFRSVAATKYATERANDEHAKYAAAQ